VHGRGPGTSKLGASGGERWAALHPQPEDARLLQRSGEGLRGGNNMEAKTRREFLATTAAATAASYSRILGANERIRLGVIGPGDRGATRMTTAAKLRAEIAALADCNKGLMDLARGKLGTPVDTYVDYKDLLARRDIDGVINATPDHLHKTVIFDTVAAGKDLYTEKPLARTIQEGS